jgi:hypothetical protein
MRKLTTLAVLALTLGLVVTASASASATTYHATFVEVGGGILGGSCGSATISVAGHVAHQCVYFNACGANCDLRTITFDDGTLVMHESVVGAVAPGNSFNAASNTPLFLQITQTIVGGTGRFAGATGGGTGRINTAADAVITSSGTITLP